MWRPGGGRRPGEHWLRAARARGPTLGAWQQQRAAWQRATASDSGGLEGGGGANRI
uniref:Uncharacterized protein n=1 Tax=Arundo donax TaxID=35708 RepID=A0A0A9EXR2_ARUDO